MSTSVADPRIIVQPPNPLDIQRARREILYGLDEANTAPQYVLASVRVCIEVSTADRGRTFDTRPIFEYPLMKEIYSRMGGSCRVIGVWYNWNEETDAKNKLHRRIWRMTRDDIMDQISTLTKRFTIPTAGGKINIFENVYGRGASLTFHKKIKESYDAFVAMITKVRKSGRKSTRMYPDLNDEEYADLAAIFEPKIEGIVGLEEIALPEINLSDDGEDLVSIKNENIFQPSRLMTMLGEAGVDSKIIKVMENLQNEGRMSEDGLRRHGELSGMKPVDFVKAIDVWKTYSKE